MNESRQDVAVAGSAGESGDPIMAQRRGGFSLNAPRIVTVAASLGAGAGGGALSQVPPPVGTGLRRGPPPLARDGGLCAVGAGRAAADPLRAKRHRRPAVRTPAPRHPTSGGPARRRRVSPGAQAAARGTAPWSAPNLLGAPTQRSASTAGRVRLSCRRRDRSTRLPGTLSAPRNPDPGRSSPPRRCGRRWRSGRPRCRSAPRATGGRAPG